MIIAAFNFPEISLSSIRRSNCENNETDFHPQYFRFSHFLRDAAPTKTTKFGILIFFVSGRNNAAPPPTITTTLCVACVICYYASNRKHEFSFYFFRNGIHFVSIGLGGIQEHLVGADSPKSSLFTSCHCLCSQRLFQVNCAITAYIHGVRNSAIRQARRIYRKYC